MRSLVLALVLVVAPSGCVLDSGGGGAADAAVYDNDTPDAAPFPGFRDAGCSGGGPSGTGGTSGEPIFHESGTSGLGCTGDGGSQPPPPKPVDAGVPDATPCDYVTFTYTSDTAVSVWVSGDFTNWASNPAAGAWQMSKNGSTWTRSGQVGPGRHLYKLIIDGTDWIADPANPDREPDGFGGENSVITVCN